MRPLGASQTTWSSLREMTSKHLPYRTLYGAATLAQAPNLSRGSETDACTPMISLLAASHASAAQAVAVAIGWGVLLASLAKLAAGQARAYTGVAFGLGAFLAAAIFLELDDSRVRSFSQAHPFVTDTASSAILLVVTVLVVDRVIEGRRTRRWQSVSQLAIQDLGRVADSIRVNLWHAVTTRRQQLVDDQPDYVSAFASGDVASQAQWLQDLLERDPEWMPWDLSPLAVHSPYNRAWDLEATVARWASLLPDDQRLADPVTTSLEIATHYVHLLSFFSHRPRSSEDLIHILRYFAAVMEACGQLSSAAGSRSTSISDPWMRSQLKRVYGHAITDPDFYVPPPELGGAAAERATRVGENSEDSGG